MGRWGNGRTKTETQVLGIQQVMTVAQDLDNIQDRDNVVRPRADMVNTENLARALVLATNDLNGGLDGIAMIANKLSYLDMIQFAEEVLGGTESKTIDSESLARGIAIWARNRVNPTMDVSEQ